MLSKNFTFYSDAPEWGGQEILAAKIASAVASKYPVTFFYYNNNFESALDANVNAVKLPFCTKLPFPIFRDHSLKRQKMLTELFQEKAAANTNLVICPGNIERSTTAIFCGKKLGYKIISYIPMVYTQKETGAPLGRIRDFFAKSIYRNIHEWIVISETQRKLLNRFVDPKVPVHVLPNPVDMPNEQVPLPKVFSEASNKTLRIATIGRLYFKQKGQDLIPQIAKKLSNTKFDFEFSIVGDGPDKKKLEALIQKNNLQGKLQIHSSIPHKDLLSRLKEKNWDMLFMPSRFEGDPIIMYEAIQNNIPVLVASAKYTDDYNMPSWMKFKENDIEDACNKIQDFSKSFNISEFQDLKEKLFNHRSTDCFQKKIFEIFSVISECSK